MSEAWYTPSKYGAKTPDTKIQASSVTFSGKTYEDLFIYISTRYYGKNEDDSVLGWRKPPTTESINSLEFITNFLQELKYIVYGTKEIFNYSNIQNKIAFSHLLKFQSNIVPQFKHLIFESLEEYFNSNNYNRFIITEVLKLEMLTKILLECEPDSQLYKALLSLASKYSNFTITREDLNSITTSLLDTSLSLRKKAALLKILSSANCKTDPPEYYHFLAIPGPGFFVPLLPSIQMTDEFSISTWFNLRDTPFNLSKKEYIVKKDAPAQWTPYLFSFRNDEGVSIALYFTLSHICYEVVSAGKASVYEYPFITKLNSWHSLVLTHVFSKDTACISLYIDGNLAGSSSGVFPKMISNFSNSYIGKSHKSSLSNQFIGSMSSFLLWDKCLDASIVASYNELGPTYQGLFHDCLECEGNELTTSMMELFGGESPMRINLAYLPSSTSKNSCYNMSHVKSNNSSENYNATLSKEALVISTKCIESILFSYGNLTYFYSICDYLLVKNSEDRGDFLELTIQLFELITSFVVRLGAFSKSFIQTGGYNILAWKIIKAGKECFTQELMTCILTLSKYIIEHGENMDLFKQLMVAFVFDLRVWKFWSYEILTYAIGYMMSETILRREYAFYIKKSVTIGPLTEIIMAFYNDEKAKSEKELATMKSFMLSFIKQIILQGTGLQTTEIDSALYYFGPQKSDYIHNLVNIMKEAAVKNQASFGSAFCNLNSVLVFNELLSSKDPELFNNGLEFFTLVINNAPSMALKNLVNNYHIWSILTYHLLGYTFDQKIYTYLLRMMIGDTGFQLFEAAATDSYMHIILNKPRVIQVFVWLVQNEMNKPDITIEHKKNVLGLAQDLIKKLRILVVANKNNRLALLRKVGWQGWVLSIFKFFETEPEDLFKSCEEDICEIISIVACQGVFNSEDGWIATVDLLGYIHYAFHYKMFSLIPNLIKTEFKDVEGAINQYLDKSSSLSEENDINESIEDSTNSKQSNVNVLIKNRKHKIHEHIEKFVFSRFFLSVLNRIFSNLRKEILTIENLVRVLNDQSSHLLLKNMANLLLFVSDMISNYFGGLVNIYNLASLSDSSKFTDLTEHDTDPINLSIAYSIIQNIAQLFEDLFVTPKISFKRFEEEADVGQGSLIKVSIRIFILKFLIQTSTTIYRYWKVISKFTDERATPIFSMKKNYVDFFEIELKKMETAKIKMNHPLVTPLLSSSDFKYVKEILSRRGEFANSQQILALVLVYVLVQIMVSHYKRILDYQPVKTDEFQLTLDATYFINNSLNGVGSLIYETLVTFQSQFNDHLKGRDKKSLMDVGLKNMKTAFKPLEFVMLVSSDNWQKAFISNLKPFFEEIVRDSSILGNEAINQIEKRSCIAADLILYSALFVQHSVYTTSAWKRSLIRLNNLVQSNITQVQQDCLLSAVNASKETEYMEFLQYQRKFIESILFHKNTDNCDILIDLKLVDWEDDYRRRYFVRKDNRDILHVNFLGKDEIYTKQIQVKNPMNNFNPSDFEQIPSPSQQKYFSSEQIKTIPKHPQFQEIKSKLPKFIDFKKEIKDATKDIEDRMKGFMTKIKSMQLHNLAPHMKVVNEQVETFSATLLCGCIFIRGDLIIYPTSEYVEFKFDKSKLSSIASRILDYMSRNVVILMFYEIIRVFSRYFVHQRNSVELFTSDRSSYFFILDNFETVCKVVSCLPERGIGEDYFMPVSRNVSLLSPDAIFEASKVRLLWDEGIISNFEYLMFINTISGRTYQDLSQYPIFPWVLSNYHDENIDLSLEKNYRDLSKPIGALNLERLAKAVDRFMSITPGSSTPPYHFSSYYSTPRYVLDYLLRLEPFTSFHYCTNGENFTHPSNIFNSISDMWNIVTSTGDDIRELTPEMFYLPEILESKKTLLTKDNEKITIPAVKLPPYAKSAQHFIDINSRALESPYVTANLPKWIDLIFGFKQKGREGEIAINIFNYLTYDSPMNKLKINNESLKTSLTRAILVDGIAPMQILFVPHPPKSQKALEKIITNTDLDMDKSFIFACTPTAGSPIISISKPYFDEATTFYTISENQRVSKLKLNVQDIIDKFSQRKLLGINIDPAEKQFVNLFEFIDNNEMEMSEGRVTFLPSGEYVAAACSYTDNSFRIYRTSDGKIVQATHKHKDRVTCIDSSLDHVSGNICYIATGSMDATVCIWTYVINEQRVGIPFNQIKSNGVLYRFLYGHHQPIYQVSINIGLGLVVSGTKTGYCTIHGMDGSIIAFFNMNMDLQYELVKIKLSKKSKIVALLSNSDKSVIKVYSDKGVLLCEKNIPENLTQFTLDDYGNFMIVSGSRNIIVVLRIDTLDVVHSYTSTSSPITCLRTISYDKILLVGLASGELGILSSKDWLQC